MASVVYESEFRSVGIGGCGSVTTGTVVVVTVVVTTAVAGVEASVAGGVVVMVLSPSGSVSILPKKLPPKLVQQHEQNDVHKKHKVSITMEIPASFVVFPFDYGCA